MKRHTLAVSLALAFLTVLALASPAAAGPPVPFRGQVDGFVTVTPLDPPQPPLMNGLYQGAGLATVLGRFTLSSPHLINTEKRTADGTHTFTAADGSTLIATFSGTAMPTATAGVLLIRETAVIKGGTGRFAGASGSFIGERLYNLATLRQTGIVVGIISVR